jgi:hypothetical protein
LLDHPRLVNQLIALERRTARGGRDSIDHAPGGAHDDVVNACAGALVEVMVEKGRPTWSVAGEPATPPGEPTFTPGREWRPLFPGGSFGIR